MTLAFEDFHVGRRFAYAPVTVAAEAMLSFARSFDPQPMHLDEEAGRAGILGGLSASGWFTASLGMRMMADAFVRDSTSQGSPGIDRMDWRKPVFAGDVLAGESVVLDARPSRSRPGIGIVRFRNEITRAAAGGSETVALSECAILFRCRKITRMRGDAA
ncbi:MaoC family dehydratase [Ensifer soli]|uniref:MaoC family dehydratase n=1 Tax=Ciceribacter sp. sgz301302 TaxID=3342379 RepID=UPI0035B785A3